MNRNNQIVYAVRTQLGTQPCNRLKLEIKKQMEGLKYD
jgi:hypothetical protein